MFKHFNLRGKKKKDRKMKSIGEERCSVGHRETEEENGHGVDGREKQGKEKEKKNAEETIEVK